MSCTLFMSCNCGGGSSSSVGSTLGGPVTGTPPTPPPAEEPRDVLSGGPWNENSPLGTNLATFADYATEQPFIDLFRSTRDWISGTDSTWDDGRPFDLDEHGWVRSLAPGQTAKALVLWETTHYRPGKYLVLYEGEGTIEYPNLAAARLVEAESRPGRHVVDLDPTRSGSGLMVAIKETNPDNYIRNIRVIAAGGVCEADALRFCDDAAPCDEGRCVPFEESYTEAPFHPDFLARTRRYTVLRYLDWMLANNSEVRTWDDRPKMDDMRWSSHGIPPEMIVELSNTLHAEPWLTLPHLTDDDYNRRFAELVKDQLDPSLRVWVEFSNEIWNGSFTQAQYAQEQGQGLSDNPFEGQLRWYADRTREVLQIWEEVLGDDRVVAVVATQAANPWTGQVVLDRGNIAEVAEVLAIAPYFGVAIGPEEVGRFSQMNVDQLIAHTEAEILPDVFGWMEGYRALAEARGLGLVAYEGGQHFIGFMGIENNDRINTLLDELNRDPRMERLYTQYLEHWRQNGGQLFVHYLNVQRWSKWGRWGALEHLLQDPAEAPKFRALEQFIDEHPKWWDY